MDIDKTEIEQLIEEAAATCIMPRYESLKEHEITAKTGMYDLVTAADIETEKSLSEFLLKRYPGSIVIGEESVAAGTADISVLSSDREMIWVIDPVDGTYNFVHGGRDFAVMLACVSGGETIHGWIYDVLGKNFGYAGRGEGAWCGGERANVSSPESIRSAEGHINTKYFPDFAHEHIKKYAGVIDRYYSLGCSAREYLRVATGNSDFAIYSRTKPWDHLAGTLMVSEAGGVVRKWDGYPYKPSDKGCGLIIAADERLWHNLQDFYISPILQEQLRRSGSPAGSFSG